MPLHRHEPYSVSLPQLQTSASLFHSAEHKAQYLAEGKALKTVSAAPDNIPLRGIGRDGAGGGGGTQTQSHKRKSKTGRHKNMQGMLGGEGNQEV